MIRIGETYIFVIDTDSYAGNFERQMCAYLTGDIGESEVGKEEREAYLEEVGEKDSDLTCILNGKPSSIWPSLKGYNSVAIYLYNRPEDDLISRWKERAVKFCKYWGAGTFGAKDGPSVQVLGFRLLKHVSKIESETVL